MNTLSDAQKATLDEIRNAAGPVVLPVSRARALVNLGLIKSDGSFGHGRAKAAYVPVK